MVMLTIAGAGAYLKRGWGGYGPRPEISEKLSLISSSTSWDNDFSANGIETDGVRIFEHL